MLVLSRFKNERIKIGKAGDVLTEPIYVDVVEIRGDRIRLGIEAQVDVKIHRLDKPIDDSEPRQVTHGGVE